MFDKVDIPEKFVDCNGRVESDNSYNTFLNFYLNKSKVPTAQELSNMSGFKLSTCRTWITINQYRKRWESYNLDNFRHQKDLVDNVNEFVLSELAILKINHIKLHTKLNDDVLKRLDNIDNMDTLDNERLELIKESGIIQKNYNTLVNTLLSSDKYDEFIEASTDITDDLNKLISFYSEYRHKSNFEALEKLKKEYKDKDF